MVFVCMYVHTKQDVKKIFYEENSDNWNVVWKQRFSNEFQTEWHVFFLLLPLANANRDTQSKTKWKKHTQLSDRKNLVMYFSFFFLEIVINLTVYKLIKCKMRHISYTFLVSIFLSLFHSFVCTCNAYFQHILRFFSLAWIIVSLHSTRLAASFMILMITHFLLFIIMLRFFFFRPLLVWLTCAYLLLIVTIFI